MTSGRDAYADINRQIEVLRAETAAQSGKLARISAQLEQTQTLHSRETARLARLRLDALGASQVVEALGAAEREAIALMAQRQQAQAQCEAAIEQSQQRQLELERQRSEAMAEHEMLQAQLHEEHEAVADQCRSNAAWQALNERADQLAEQAAQAQEKAEQVEADRRLKGQPYEIDPLFMYLWQRQFGSAGYRAGALVRSLDGWVAGLIRYREAARNYRLLLALPEKLHQHAGRMQSEAQQAQIEREQLERNALMAAGVMALAERVEQAQEHDERLRLQLDAEEQTHATLLTQRALLAEGEDDYTRRALAALGRAIAVAPDPLLQAVAQQTPTVDDDAAVAAITQARADRARLEQELGLGKQAHQTKLDALARVEELRQRFRQQRYDRDESEFDTGLDWAAVLTGVLRGALEVGRAWERVQRHQRDRRPPVRLPTPRSGTAGPSRGGGFGGTVFKGGGGFGGSGFKTGGGF